MTPAVARASAGAIEHLPVAVVTNLARYLEEVKGPDLWVYGAAGESSAKPMWDTDLSGGTAIVLGAEGRGLRPLVRRTCDALVSIPLAGRVESLNVSGRRGVTPLRSAAAAWLTSTSSTATTCSTPAGSPTRASCVDALASLRRGSRRTRDRRFRRPRRYSSVAARSRFVTRRTPTRCSSASRPSTGGREHVVLVTSDATLEARVGHGGGQGLVGVLRERASAGAARRGAAGRLAGKLDDAPRPRLGSRSRPARSATSIRRFKASGGSALPGSCWSSRPPCTSRGC